MPEHNNNKERILAGEIPETPSSDAYIARGLVAIRAEIEATGKIVDILSAEVLRPRLTTPGLTGSVIDEEQGSKKSSGSPLARFASSIFKERQEKQAA